MDANRHEWQLADGLTGLRVEWLKEPRIDTEDGEGGRGTTIGRSWELGARS